MVTTTRRLGHEDAARFARDGFLVGLDAFDEHEAGASAAEVAALAATGIPGHPAPWQQKTHLLLPSLDDLVLAPRLTGLVASILGEDLLVLSADVFLKPPHSPRRIPWHQDVNYWDLRPWDVLTAWVALTAATPENGGMRYAAGGHAARIEHVERPDETTMLSRGQELAVDVDPATVVDVRLRPGQVSFHHALAPHSSGPNTTGEARIGFAIRYAATRVSQHGGPPIAARLVRGHDVFHHFMPEDGPDAALSAAALAQHQRSLAPHAATNFSTI